LFSKKPSIESTVGVDCESFNLAKGNISVWDFAGQLEYTATHALFLTMEVMILLIFILKKFQLFFFIL